MREWLKRVLGIGQPDPFDEAMRLMREAAPGEVVRLPAGIRIRCLAKDDPVKAVAEQREPNQIERNAGRAPSTLAP